MSSSQTVVVDWATKPIGKVARGAIGVGGMVAAFIALMMAGVVTQGWLMVLAGVALAATSVRAAWFPSLTRLMTVLTNLVVIILLTQI